MPILELREITKKFGKNLAVDSINFTLRRGEIHAILGENGAGKSTLMNVIYGMIRPDAGEILIDGTPIEITSPEIAIANGIGMVHQHFMLIPSMTVAENLALTIDRSSFFFDPKLAKKKVSELSDRYGLEIDPTAYIWELPVGLQQRVEILKALAINAQILILDEPTAVLTPQEIRELFVILDRLRAEDLAIIFISHKLKEVIELSDRVTVLRRGKSVFTSVTANTTADQLAREMVGQDLPKLDRTPSKIGKTIIELKNLIVGGDRGVTAVNGVDLSIQLGEIVGIAGVDGNGQIELANALIGLTKVTSGNIIYNDRDITDLPASHLRRFPIGYIPSDRQSEGLVLPFSLTENFLLNLRKLEKFRRWIHLDRKDLRSSADLLIQKFDVRTTGQNAIAKSLSGGNQQKIVIARELSTDPEFLIAFNPTRGLDIGAIDYVHRQLLTQQKNGCAILLISTELDEVLTLSDRIFVMFDGKLTDATEHRNDRSKIGLLMAGNGGK